MHTGAPGGGGARRDGTRRLDGAGRAEAASRGGRSGEGQGGFKGQPGSRASGRESAQDGADSGGSIDRRLPERTDLLVRQGPIESAEP